MGDGMICACLHPLSPWLLAAGASSANAARCACTNSNIDINAPYPLRNQHSLSSTCIIVPSHMYRVVCRGDNNRIAGLTEPYMKAKQKILNPLACTPNVNSASYYHSCGHSSSSFTHTLTHSRTGVCIQRTSGLLL